MHRGKLKIRGSARKRLRVTGTGKIKRRRAYHSHILTKKNAKRKRRLDSDTLISAVDMPRMKRILGI